MSEKIEHVLNRIGEYSQTVSLSDNQKNQMRTGLLSAISKQTQTPQKSPYMVANWFSHISRKTFIYTPIAAVMILILGGSGMAAAAEGALPGDLLYPIKTNITEQVLSLFSHSAEEKAEFATELVNRRLGEINQLATEGRLTSGARSKIEQQVSNHLAQVDVQVAALKKDNKPKAALSVSSQVETTLRSNEQALQSINTSATSESGQSEITLVADNLKERLDTISLNNVLLEQQVDQAQGDADFKKLVLQKQKDAKESIEANQELLTEVQIMEGTDVKEISKIKDQINESQITFDGTAALSEESNMKDAYLGYQSVLRSSVEIKSALNAQKSIGTIPVSSETSDLSGVNVDTTVEISKTSETSDSINVVVPLTETGDQPTVTVEVPAGL